MHKYIQDIKNKKTLHQLLVCWVILKYFSYFSQKIGFDISCIYILRSDRQVGWYDTLFFFHFFFLSAGIINTSVPVQTKLKMAEMIIYMFYAPAPSPSPQKNQKLFFFSKKINK